MLVSAADNLFDQAEHLLERHQLAAPAVKRIAPGQPVGVYIFVRDPAEKDGQSAVDGTLQLTFPDGRSQVLFQDRQLTEKSVSGDGLLPLAVRFAARPDDPEGKYVFQLQLCDRNDQSQTQATAEFTMTHRAPEPLRGDAESLEKFVNTYYADPQPEHLLDFFDAFIAAEPAASRQPNYTPLPILYGLSAAFRRNPQLWRDLAERSKNLSPKHRKYLAMLITTIGPDAVAVADKFADENLRRYLKSQGAVQLDFADISSPVHIDALWAEFLFTGGSAPIRRIVGVLGRRDLLSPEEAQAKEKPLSEEDRRKLVAYVIDQAAQWSLEVNAARHQLVCNYLEAMLERGELPDARATEIVKQNLSKAKRLSHSAGGEEEN